MSVTTFGGNLVPSDLLPNILTGKQTQVDGYLGVQFVSGDFGSDAFDGITPNTPLKNLDTAFNRCLGGANEVIFILGGSAAVTYSSKIASGGSGLVWNKNYTHLIGIGAAVALGQRARVTNGASTNLLTPLLSVTANGCAFRNIEFYNGGASATAAAVCIAITGSRNEFTNCQISGGGITNSATNAACRSLTIAGPGGENTFRHCYIGLTTVARNTTSTEIELTLATVRNVFEDCTIASYSTSTGTLLVKIGAAGIDRSLTFRACIFQNPLDSGGATLAQALSINSGAGGIISTLRCLVQGCTKVETTASTLVFAETATSLLGLANTA